MAKDIISKFMRHKIEFVDNSVLEEFIKTVDFIQPCYKKNEPSICVMNEEDSTKSKLLLLKDNLHDGRDNSKYYFHYLTDSMLRKGFLRVSRICILQKELYSFKK